MIKIRKDDQSLLVTNGAYKEIYEPQGWLPEEEAEVASPIDDNDGINDNIDDDIDDEDDTDTDEEEEKAISDEELVNKPLGQMTTEELKRYASILEVNVEGLNRKAIRGAIRAALS